ncbi:deoxynucleotidyltransferase terminal-interacting protein 1 isoform X4 [Urocitellus parryii]|uniref:deoxynucleotidyltransferase terminal-interacting protein 1 isoform X4 n=1 Tax=Urocitellus parryii TaxID=9999 RepID=UPI000E55A6EC|nr:deoxynucleotidyltransferase terminal-interacting protein 1 isoform X4 [Urocitellus parryii]
MVTPQLRASRFPGQWAARSGDVTAPLSGRWQSRAEVVGAGGAMGATGDAEQPRGPGGAERGGTELGDAGAAGQLVLMNPWNIMIKHRQVQRRGRRSQMTTSFTDPAISMDLLRAVLQPSINEEIQTVFNKYMKFFQKAALNVRDNIGEEVDAEQLIQEACRSCLEQAKLLFSDGEKVIPRLTHELPGIKRGRQAEEECTHRGSPVPKKRKGRPPGHILSNDRAAAGMVWKPKSSEPIRREGPKQLVLLRRSHVKIGMRHKIKKGPGWSWSLVVEHFPSTHRPRAPSKRTRFYNKEKQESLIPQVHERSDTLLIT